MDVRFGYSQSSDVLSEMQRKISLSRIGLERRRFAAPQMSIAV